MIRELLEQPKAAREHKNPRNFTQTGQKTGGQDTRGLRPPLGCFFAYGSRETDYLSNRDKRLGEAIRKLGWVKRPVNPDIFQSLIYQIIGQQISTKANQTIWDRMVAGLGAITPRVISNLSPEALQQYGLSWRKVGYIKEVADRVYNGSLQLDELPAKSDSKVCRLLSSLPGIGK